VTDRDWASVFSETFHAPVSAVQARIWAQVLGDEYPASLDTYSYVTYSDLERAAEELTVPAGGVLADVACGRGGPGLWLASRLGTRLIGLDIADTAVAAASDRARALGLDTMAEYRVATFEETGLADASVDGAVSFDALLFSPDKAAAIRELARVLRVGARLVVTTFDYHRQPVGRPFQVADHRPLLEAAGFSVLAYEATRDWREHLERIDGLLFESVEELAAESGQDADELRAGLEEMHATTACMTRRVLFVAELTGLPENG